MTVRKFVTAPPPSNVSRDGILERVRRGKSAIKRAAIVPWSRCIDGQSGSAAINEANLWVAVSPGNRANLSASCQGSISNRASAESTLSGMSFLSSPIGANRKSSNSVPRTETEAELLISITELHCRYPTERRMHGGVPRKVRKLHGWVGQQMFERLHRFSKFVPIPMLHSFLGVVEL
jgi:hypothetical protein